LFKTARRYRTIDRHIITAADLISSDLIQALNAINAPAGGVRQAGNGDPAAQFDALPVTAGVSAETWRPMGKRWLRRKLRQELPQPHGETPHKHHLSRRTMIPKDFGAY
jgi:hypothetical protein